MVKQDKEWCDNCANDEEENDLTCGECEMEPTEYFPKEACSSTPEVPE